MTKTELRAHAQAWLADDPDPITRANTQALLDQDDVAGLQACFGERLAFGTAGLRGPLGPGPNRMNEALVRRVAAGLGDYLLAQPLDAKARGVAIGFDGRHGSKKFAAATARVLAGLGIPSFLFDDVVPTPQLAHALVALNCAAGVMVTASHNPPQDNGYKVYWANGAQIIEPHDEGISACIDRYASLAQVATSALADLKAAGVVRPVPADVKAAYLKAVDGLRVYGGPTDLRIVYTAMHGVGAALVREVLTRNGYTDLHFVPEQAEPDADFPTVAFPNPEEPGALDLAMALAAKVGADVIVANDPDADRLAVAVPNGAGGWRQLTGNQVGQLIAAELLASNDRPDRLVATTIVSSGMLGQLAKAHGATCVETLTGFKWIANAALAWPGEFVMGYEEALGYSVGPVVRDKDGVSATLILADIAARAKAEGATLLDRVADLYRRMGLYATRQKSLTLPGSEGKARIEAIMDGLRREPPKVLAGVAVAQIRDILTGEARSADGAVTPIDLPSSNVLAFDLANGSRVLARPSGTEPKIKFYFEVRSTLGAGEALAAGEARAGTELDALQADFLAQAGVK
ncbi:MAG: phospho-sugar mutase [Myxococcales bacterium]|nr:phospho-sugar mutase [Myxococcales bacterium]